MACLYLVSTPIGNLEDITLRAIRVLSEVDFIACEDTRKTGMLLLRMEIKTEAKLLSYFEENELKRIPQIIKFLNEGKNVALVSSAGTPTISDPGFKLVRECIEQGIKVESVPGASAILTALTSSGLPTDKFLFLGYLPKKQGKRKKVWGLISSTLVTIIFFESPHRLVKSLQEIQNEFGDIEIVICRELTKLHEEVTKEKLSQAIAHFEKVKPKGEFTLLFNTSPK